MYEAKLDMDLPLSEQKLMKETKIILSLVYRSYLCTSEQKRKFKKDDMDELKMKQMKLNKVNSKSKFQF